MKTEISEYEQQALDFLKETNTTITMKYKTFGKHFIDDTDSRAIWRVRIANSNGSYNFDFGNSIAEGNNKPTEYSILACIEKYDPEDFNNFCDNFGYDTDSIKAFKTYKGVCKEWENIDKLFTSDQLELLREIQ